MIDLQGVIGRRGRCAAGWLAAATRFAQGSSSSTTAAAGSGSHRTCCRHLSRVLLHALPQLLLRKGGGRGGPLAVR
jgi:hypothetical protein